MSAHRMKPLPKLDLTNQAEINTWLMKVEDRLTTMRPLITDATTRKLHRRYGRRYLRRHLARHIRDILVMLEALVPLPPPPPEEPQPTNPLALSDPPASLPEAPLPEDLLPSDPPIIPSDPPLAA